MLITVFINQLPVYWMEHHLWDSLIQALSKFNDGAGYLTMEALEHCISTMEPLQHKIPLVDLFKSVYTCILWSTIPVMYLTGACSMWTFSWWIWWHSCRLSVWQGKYSVDCRHEAWCHQGQSGGPLHTSKYSRSIMRATHK